LRFWTWLLRNSVAGAAIAVTRDRPCSHNSMARTKLGRMAIATTLRMEDDFSGELGRTGPQRSWRDAAGSPDR